jgi:hypothetical protein
MKYALGNMLNGAGGLNPDSLALDLQFAADKTLVARKGPTPVFTRGSTGTFVGSNGLIQTAAVNTERFDHDPVTLASRGLLIEEGRTNLILQSENIASATWVKAGGSISSVANVRPDGNANSELFSEDGATATHRIFQSFTGTIGTSYTLSVFLKFAGRDQIYLENRSIATNPYAVFNIQNGTIGFVSSGLSAVIQAYPNGWYRCSITGTSTLSGGNYIIGGFSGGAQSYTGLNGPAFYIYGSQVEAGSFATSYIPTTTGCVVRSADECSITGGNFTSFWNTNEGAMFASGDPRGGASVATLVMANSGANANQIAFDRSTLQVKFGIANSGTYTATISQNITNGSFVKISGAYATNNARSAVNGVLGTPDTSVIVPTNLNRFNIGSAGAANTEFTNGCISEIKYFRKPLSNAKLQALTV